MRCPVVGKDQAVSSAAAANEGREFVVGIGRQLLEDMFPLFIKNIISAVFVGRKIGLGRSPLDMLGVKYFERGPSRRAI
jgi:hypothetical protein